MDAFKTGRRARMRAAGLIPGNGFQLRVLAAPLTERLQGVDEVIQLSGLRDQIKRHVAGQLFFFERAEFGLRQHPHQNPSAPPELQTRVKRSRCVLPAELAKAKIQDLAVDLVFEAEKPGDGEEYDRTTLREYPSRAHPRARLNRF